MREFFSKDAVSAPEQHSAVSLPVKIVIGAILGIVAGVVLGDRAAVLQPIGDAYASMLQIAVFPYLLCSLMYSLGRLTPDMSRRLLRAGWAPFVFLWILTLATIWILAHGIPPAPPPFSLTASAVQDKSHLMQLLIPSNP